jgi:glycosyltransferase involved in cell wall biosynthesis
MEWRQRVVRVAREVRPRAIFCHSVVPLRSAVEACRKTGAALIYDAHELETQRMGARGLRKMSFSYLERRFIRRCGAVICVSGSIADWYEKLYGINKPAVVRNIPDTRIQMDFSGSNLLRERFGISGQHLLFIYQGGLETGRRVEQMLRIFSRVRAGRHIVFMGFGSLEGAVREAAAHSSQIHFLPAVPPQEVLRYTASADVGIVGVENRCLSYYFSLPNKIFEYLLAGTPALAPNYPEMRRIVEANGTGWIVEDEDRSWQTMIESLDLERVTAAKEKVRAVSGRFSWRNEESCLFSAYRQALMAAEQPVPV